MISPVSKNVCV
jgi:mannosyl-oligosaccharide glucosidase